jgi:hypothetical protein
VAPPRIAGIDFSGARDAGRAIWIAEGTRDGVALRLADCRPASELSGGATAREPALAALVQYIAAQGEAVVGVDAPFALPEPLAGGDGWLAFVRGFAARWPDAASFRTRCRADAGGRELRRGCDIEARTPFCAYNLRLHRQTWHVIAELIAPLVLTGRAAAAPMQAVVPGRPILLEACPASFLKHHPDGLYKPYKGAAAAHRKQRRTILTALIAHRHLHEPSAAQRRRILDDAGGDALDAVIAGVIALKESADPENLRPRKSHTRQDRLEARVYF